MSPFHPPTVRDERCQGLSATQLQALAFPKIKIKIQKRPQIHFETQKDQPSQSGYFPDTQMLSRQKQAVTLDRKNRKPGAGLSSPPVPTEEHVPSSLQPPGKGGQSREEGRTGPAGKRLRDRAEPRSAARLLGFPTLIN